MQRYVIFLFGLVSYALFFAAFLYSIGFVGGFLTPTSLDGPATMPMAEAIAIDLALLGLFAVQHSGMARPAFKAWLTRFVPRSAERSVYVLASTIALMLILWKWAPIGGAIWDTEGAARAFMIGLYLFGWALLLYATFLIDHFDLFGLRQVWTKLRSQAEHVHEFRTPGLYALVRHPIYVGWLIIFWAAPTMSTAHLLFAMVTTIYILIAIQFEERDLVTRFGAKYEDYRRRVPALIPRLSEKKKSPAIAS